MKEYVFDNNFLKSDHMKRFKEVEQGKKYAEMEHDVMQFWSEDKTF